MISVCKRYNKIYMYGVFLPYKDILVIIANSYSLYIAHQEGTRSVLLSTHAL